MNKRFLITFGIVILFILVVATVIIIKFRYKDDDSKDIKERTNQCLMETQESKLPPLEHDESIKSRILYNVEFKPLKIYVDLNYMKYQASLDKNLSKNLNKVLNSIDKAKTTLEKLFNVVPFQKNWRVRGKILENLGIPKYNTDFFKKEGEPIRTLRQIGYDIYIFPKFGNITSTGSFGIYYYDSNYRPIITKMTLSTKFNFEKKDADKYLDIFFLHYFTHLLGFSGTYIKDHFPGHPYLVQKDKFGIERHYITSKKVVETAKKYFGCNKITGVELDNKGLINGDSTHWEPRILLGDYMTTFGIEYEEQTISEITLSLLEDSGWYKANYYTGGLMRFGKNKGCDFIFEKCVNPNTHKTIFNNEFFDELYNNRKTPSCSSGRLSRNYKIFYQYSSDIPQEFRYFDKSTRGGSSAYADYCPIMDSTNLEMINDYFVGNCKNGSGAYGYYAPYKNKKDNKYYYGINNTKLPEELGETLNKDNSFCVISSLVPKNIINNYNYDFVTPRAMCHEMFCSDRSLTIKINDKYIVCPRQGGKVELDNYNGFILCPDYNLICTGSTICNDLFDCVYKKSLVKNPLYDYTINTNQNYASEEKKITLEAYEESTNGFCPKDCALCNEKKQCLKNKKHCDKIDINCAECSEDNKYCTKCKNNLYLYQNKCYEKKTSIITGNKKEKLCSKLITGCKTCINDKICTECNSGYGLDYDTRKCKTINSLAKTYYYDNKDRFYKKCTYGVSNCLYCTNINFCYRCNKGFFQIEYDNYLYDYTRCYSKAELPNKLSYYNKNSTHYPLCSSKIPGCNTCNTIGSKCTHCFPGYNLNKQKTSCVIQGKATKRLPHCLKQEGNKCLLCEGGYTHKKKERYWKCFLEPQNNEYYYKKSEDAYIKCLDSPYLERCLRCKDEYTCIECDNKAHVLLNGKCVRISN